MEKQVAREASGKVDFSRVDFDSLQKGDEFPPEALEAILQMKKDDPVFPLRLLSFRQVLKTELKKRGLAVTIRQDQRTLRICTDKEALRVNKRRADLWHDAGWRLLEDKKGVDATNLDTTAERRERERQIEVQGRYMQAIQTETGRLFPKGYRRKTPALGLEGT